MVWHIFKKDWKLLWVFVIIVASLHLIAAFVLFKRGLFGEDATLEMLSEAIPILAFFASMFLIAAIVHLEAIPGLRQDWLVRPIQRGSLLLEKFLFVVIVVAGPIFAANLLQGLADGFSSRASVFSATSYVIFLLFFLILPLFAFASVTQNMTEAFIFGCGCTFMIGAFLLLADYINQSAHGNFIVVTHSGVGWIGEVFRFVLVAIAASFILWLQYFRRKTSMSRLLVVVFGAFILASQFIPWRLAFAIEQRLSPKPSAGALTAVAFDQTRGRFKSPSGFYGNVERRGNENNAELFLPLQVAGIRDDEILLTDRVEVHVNGKDGRTVYHGMGGGFEVDKGGTDPAEANVYQRIALPIATYFSAKDKVLQIHLDYSLTQFALVRSYSMPAVDGDVRMPEMGWCQTKINGARTSIALHCIVPGKAPVCGTAFLQNVSTGARNPAQSSCRSDYGPFNDSPLPDAFTRFGTTYARRCKTRPRCAA
ncbi:MAG: hypothetical protein ACRD3N_13835 [Terracidiphilus sp.]